MDHPTTRDWAAASATLRTSALRVFLLSIATNAGLGIWALLTDDFGSTETKVLVTSLLVSAGMLVVLVNAAPLQQRVLWPVPALAIASGVGSIALLVALLWAELDDEEAIKLAVSGLVVAAGATLAGLIGVLPLAADYEPVRWVHGALVAVLAGTVIAGLWAEIDTSWYGRTIGVEGVVVAALTVAIPVLWKFGTPRADGGEPPVEAEPDSGGATEPAPTSIGQLALPSPVSIEGSASVRALLDRFAAGAVDFAVVAAESEVIGVVAGADILRIVREGADLDEVRVVDVMTTEPVTVPSGATIAEAARLLSDHRVGYALVVGDGTAVVSVHDLLAALAPLPAPSRS